MDIKLLIQQLAGKQKPIFKLARVIEVDSVNYTCTVEIDMEELPLETVRLKAAIDKTANGFILIPKLKSSVIIAQLDNYNAFIIQYSDIETILATGVSDFVFNEGKNGGVIITDKLKTEIEKLNQSITTMKNACKNIAIAVDATVPGTSAAFITATATMQTADLSNIVNTHFKH